MQQKRVYWLLVLGLTAVVGAWAVRHRLQKLRTLPPASVRDPRQEAAEQELIRLRKAVVAAPTDSAARWALIEFYNRYGLLDQAGEQIVLLLKQDPKDQRAHLALAHALLAKRRFALAEAAYRDDLDMHSKSLDAWHGLAAALIKESRFLEANAAAQHALDLKSSDTDSHLLLATSALEYADQFPDPTAHAGELEFARKELEILKKALPDNADIYYALGRCYKGLHNREGAITNLQRAHTLQPDRQDVAQILAIAYRANNQRAEAQTLLEEMTRRPQASAANFDLLGQVYLLSPQADGAQKALQAFKKATELVPKSTNFQENLGSACYQVGDMKAARTVFENVTRLDPHRAYAFQQLSLIYTRLGEPKLAATAARLAKEATFNEQQLTQIQELCKKHPESVNLHLLLANRYRDLHMAGPSRDEYLTILRLDPQNTHVPPEIRRAAQADSLPRKQ